MAGPLLTQEDTAPAAQSPAGISLQDDSTTDAAIERRLRTILNEIGDFDGGAVEVNAGVVRLTGEVVAAGDINDLEALVSRIQGVVTVENAVVETSDLSDRLIPAWDRFTSRLDQIIAYLPLLLVSLAVFLAIALCGFLLAGSRQPFERLAPNRFIADIYRQIVRVVFVLAALVVAPDIVGAVALIGTLLGAAGIVGLAIGFSVRDTVENFVASITLSVRQPFRPNDFVQIEGKRGDVVRMTARATVLLSPDGNHVRIPNATVFKSRIVEFTRNSERRFEFELGVDADAGMTAAQAVGLQLKQIT
ncbi:mechanosensitive ion channel domain-containing protein [Algihabitans sp.]|uniref:mechanosensitive ion channel domain-containing protein n=1 Tax=Algihabitans sp. TaxID=2821514 RepID=UPI003BABE05F